MINLELNREVYLNDFKERCLKVSDLNTVMTLVIKADCPFLDMGFDKDLVFRKMRRYYRANIDNGLRNDLLKIIEEVQNVKYVGD